MSDHLAPDPPSAFVVHWARRLAGAAGTLRALDVAMGHGRHAQALAALGCRVFGVDRDCQAVADAVRRAAAAGLHVRGWCADLTEHPLPRERFDLIVIARYLQRDLFASLTRALAPGGTLLYETFTEEQRAKGRGPTSPDHLLRPGELRAAFADLDITFYEEVVERDALARLVGRKPG
jgi:SAM-dependent methyltransferase